MCYYFKLLVLNKLWLQLAISALVFTQTITIHIFWWKHNIYLSLIFRQGVIINKSDGTLTIMTETHDSLKASATDNLSDEELNVKDEVNLTVLTVSTIIRSFFYTLNLSLHQRFITYMYWRWTTRRRLSDLKSCPRALWPLIKKQKTMKIFPAQRAMHLALLLSKTR